MTRSAWLVTLALTGLALLAAWFFGIDAHHAVVLVGAASAAGIANGLLESVDLVRPRLTPLPTPSRGLADVQSLEFSLSAAEPGARGVLELQGIGRAILRARPDIPLSPALTALLAGTHTHPPTHREIDEHLAELEHALQISRGPA